MRTEAEIREARELCRTFLKECRGQMNQPIQINVAMMIDVLTWALGEPDNGFGETVDCHRKKRVERN